MTLRAALNFLYASAEDFLNAFSQMRNRRKEKLPLRLQRRRGDIEKKSYVKYRKEEKTGKQLSPPVIYKLKSRSYVKC